MSVSTDALKMSKHTTSLLKNFSSLNSNLLIKPGNIINTITPAKNVVAQATIEENFDTEIGIWDLNKFLGTVSLFDDPEFYFGEKSVVIKGSNDAKVNYFYSEPKLLTTLDREIKLPEVAIKFDLDESSFSELQRVSSVLQLPDLCIRSNDNGEIEMIALDKKSPTTNSYSIVIGDNDTSASFEYYIKISNMMLMPGSYSVSVCKSVVSMFNHQDFDLVYYIALESDSKFSEE